MRLESFADANDGLFAWSVESITGVTRHVFVAAQQERLESRRNKEKITAAKSQYSILSGFAAQARNPASASSRIIWKVGTRRCE